MTSRSLQSDLWAGRVTFGHQGGWDEALFVVVPILILGALLFYAYIRQPSTSTEADPDAGIGNGAHDDCRQL